MVTVLIRTAILYMLVLITMRIMGKRQVGQLEPFELAITIMISELASLPMQDTKIPLINGIIPIITLLVLEVCIAAIQLKSLKARKLLSGKPSILIKDGEINIQELKNLQFNLNDLFIELRQQGYFDLQDIQYAILETSGEVSILPKVNKTPVTKEDMKIQAEKPMLPITLIMDGKVISENLTYAKKSHTWLDEKLKLHNIASAGSVFLAYIDSKGNFVYQRKYEVKK